MFPGGLTEIFMKYLRYKNIRLLRIRNKENHHGVINTSFQTKKILKSNVFLCTDEYDEPSLQSANSQISPSFNQPTFNLGQMISSSSSAYRKSSAESRIRECLNGPEPFSSTVHHPPCDIHNVGGPSTKHRPECGRHLRAFILQKISKS